jgi:2-iminobutanoate/2-iminopropanoate deaminase
VAEKEFILGLLKQVADSYVSVVGRHEAAEADLTHVVKTTIFLTDLNHFSSVNKIYAENFKGVFPARSTVEVSSLPKGAEIEVEAIVHLPR